MKEQVGIKIPADLVKVIENLIGASERAEKSGVDSVDVVEIINQAASKIRHLEPNNISTEARLENLKRVAGSIKGIKITDDDLYAHKVSHYVEYE